jgi:hypothetical protein
LGYARLRLDKLSMSGSGSDFAQHALGIRSRHLLVHYPCRNGRMHYGADSHGIARMTEVVRRAIQHSQVSLRALSKRYGVNSTDVELNAKLNMQAQASSSYIAKRAITCLVFGHSLLMQQVKAIRHESFNRGN